MRVTRQDGLCGEARGRSPRLRARQRGAAAAEGRGGQSVREVRAEAASGGEAGSVAVSDQDGLGVWGFSPFACISAQGWSAGLVSTNSQLLGQGKPRPQRRPRREQASPPSAPPEDGARAGTHLTR